MTRGYNPGVQGTPDAPPLPHSTSRTYAPAPEPRTTAPSMTRTRPPPLAECPYHAIAAAIELGALAFEPGAASPFVRLKRWTAKGWRDLAEPAPVRSKNGDGIPRVCVSYGGRKLDVSGPRLVWFLVHGWLPPAVKMRARAGGMAPDNLVPCARAGTNGYGAQGPLATRLRRGVS